MSLHRNRTETKKSCKNIDDDCIGKKETYKMVEMKKIMGDDQTFWSWEMILFSRVIFTEKLTDVWKASIN